MSVRPVVHLVLHLAVPAAVAWRWWPARPWHAWALMVATLLVDLDHLLAEPLYDPSRCSLGFHPLHSAWALGLYVVAATWRPTRLVGVGLLIHMALDGVDCLWMAAA